MAVEQRDANALNFDHAVHEFFRLLRGNLSGVGGESFAVRHNVNPILPRCLVKADGAHDAPHLDKLAVLLAADQLLAGNRFCVGQVCLPNHFYGSGNDDWRVLTWTGYALDLHPLARRQGRHVGVQGAKINAGRIVLNKSRVKTLLAKRHHPLQPDGQCLGGLLGAQASHLRRREQFLGGRILPRRQLG